MKVVSGRELCRVLQKNGWALLRVHRSHHYYGKEGSEVKLSVPVRGTQSLKPGLLRSQIKAAGLSEDDL